MDAERRIFLKSLLGGGIGALALGAAGTARADSRQAATLPGYPDQYGVLVDTTQCVGCRRCEWACKDWNKLPNQKSLKEYETDRSVFAAFRRPKDDTYTVLNSYPNPRDPSKPIYVKTQCMHCFEPGCASSCFVKAFSKTPVGAVIHHPELCVGCRYCLAACPFMMPAYEYYNAFTPQVKKCTFCFDRISKEGGVPACVDICPVETMTFGRRDNLLELAQKKIRDNPSKYYDHVYGAKEVGGTAWMYLSGIPFTKIGFRDDLGTVPIPKMSKPFLSLVSPVFITIPPLCMGLYAFKKIRDREEKEAIKRALEQKEGK